LEFLSPTGVSPGLLVVPQRRELGFMGTWGFEGRVRLSLHHSLLAFFEIDLLFEALGFRDSRALYSGGLGWVVVF